jgi:flagellar protein FlaG
MDINTNLRATGSMAIDLPPTRASAPRTAAPAVSDLPVAAPAVAGSSGFGSAVPPSGADLKSAIEAGSKALQGFNQSLEFQIDEKSKQSVVKVVDTQTKEVIRQIPTPEFLRIAENIDSYVQAHLLHEKA